MGHFRMVEIADSLDVMYIGISSEFISSFSTTLACAVVSFQRLSTDSPPFLTVLYRPTFPLVMALTNDVFRKP
jgi:hypothetical protein